ncbi:MAG TPA: PTS mannitol transporter subunit IIA [Pasteurellaceae bacterium]|nr:PTS mannitol transporter subunit IIA [Pasteurellaceae bacterium]
MLKQYPSFPYIQRVEQIKNWQQVMIIFVQLRLTGKSIKSRYIDCLLQVHQDIGPYSVIAPQISMLNARPEDNILAQKLPLFIMQQRIDFASENDLVNLVLMLTEKDNSLYLAM